MPTHTSRQSTSVGHSTTTHATTQSNAAYSGSSSSKSGSKGLTIFVCAIIAVIAIVFVSFMSKVDRDTIEILNDDLTLAVGETVEIRIRSSAHRLTANSNDCIETSWNNGKASGDKYYVDVTGLEEGVCNLEMSEYMSGVGFRMMMWDKYDSNIMDTYYEYGTVSLDAGETYELQIRQDSDYSSYKLKIGMQKETVDISNYDIISDSVTFTDQRNVYTFTPDESGKYKFTLTDFNADCSFRLMAWDNYDSTIMDTYYEEGTVSLESGITYEIQVRQDSSIGSYNLNIEKE